jgi:membrane-bound lytic murein transglycosylase B
MVLLLGCASEVGAPKKAEAVKCEPHIGAIDRSGYLGRPQVQDFVSRVSARNGIPCAEIELALGQIEPQARALELISAPAERKTPWHQYRKIFLNVARQEAGAEFWRRNREALARAESVYQVPAEIIVAIIGVETFYGRNMGNFPVLDTIATLAFDYPPRSPFFSEELEHFLLLRRERDVEVSNAVGSYAGAMGLGQFIPSSYRNFAVDFDRDGRRNLFESEDDAIGSVANYFREHGWVQGTPVVTEVDVRGDGYQRLLGRGLELTITPEELRDAGILHPDLPRQGPASFFELEGERGKLYIVGHNNFYVITRYNRSPMYALAVYELSKAIRKTFQAEESLYSKAAR